MRQDRWQLHRAGLLNYWYYDEQEFTFAGGRLLLRGDNGSGKSVTMQSFIPLLLDGKKSPDRLDPFGSRARKIEDYLLGEKGLDTPEEKTGYLYLEFKMGPLERYLTIGMGLKVKQGQTPDSWGFVITDNRRIGHDLHLYKTDYGVGSGKIEKIPLSYRELENLVGPGGQVVKGQDEYMRMVNQHLFGFESPEKYEELIKLLVQLRSPKLSKDFKPTVIYEILNDALPALSAEDLRALSETLENMDNLKEQVEHLEKQFESVKKLEKVYTQYNRFILYDKALHFLREGKRYIEEKANFETLAQSIETEKQNLFRKEEEKSEQVNRLATVKHLKEDLEKTDAVEAGKERERLCAGNREMELKKHEKEERLYRKECEERELKLRITAAQSASKRHLKEMEESLVELDGLADEGYYEAHIHVRQEFSTQPMTFALFELWKTEVENYRKRINQWVEKARAVTLADKKQQDLQRELGNMTAQLELKEAELNKSENILADRKEEFLQQTFVWQSNNRILIDLTGELQEIAQLVPDYPQVSYERLMAPIHRRFSQKHQEIQTRLVSLEHQKDLAEAQQNEILQQLEEWRNKKDPEPPCHPETEAMRKRLSEQGVPHIPFFAAVEFRPEVEENLRAQLESALHESGLLNTWIIPRHWEEKELVFETGLAGAYFKRNPQIMRPTLLKYLEPALPGDSALSAGDVDEVLRSILIDDGKDGETVISGNGSYRIGLKTGKAPTRSQAIYIGREARRKFRQSMLERLQTERERVQMMLHELNQGLQICRDALQTLQLELNAFPDDRAMREAFEQYDGIERDYKHLLRQQAEKDRQWNTALADYKERKRELQNLLTGEKVPASEEILTACRDAMIEYQLKLRDLITEHSNYLHTLEVIKTDEDKLEDLYTDQDGLRREIGDFRQKLKTNQARIQSLEQLMRELGIEEINRQMEECLRELEELPGQIDDLTSEIATRKANLSHAHAEYDRQKSQLENRQQMVKEYEKILMEEVGLRYYFQDEQLSGREKPSQLAHSVVKELQDWVKHSQNTKQKMTNKLSSEYYNEFGNLQDYHLNLEDISTSSEAVDTDRGSLSDLAARVEVTVLFQGKKISLYGFYRRLEEDLQFKRELLDEEDRRLYEDIILKGLGRTIQYKIQRAAAWVKEMNKLMEERDTSSGLTFSLQWIPRGTRNDLEMDADDLVELLKRDPRLLHAEDLQRLISHFRSRIQEARSMMEVQGTAETLQKAIEEVLDYRQWFRFVLYYQKEGQRKKELTNHVFDTFSGGEKAMAMYIPLFSAVYSHYTQASEEAPRIISLDEAFAGVDENNIKDMFALVNQLGFNFIMNSQILWGDYDTLPALGIAELIRPKNARCVSVIHYYWNGKTLVRETAVPQNALEIPVMAEEY